MRRCVLEVPRLEREEPMRISRGSASADAARTAVLPCQRGALGQAPERRKTEARTERRRGNENGSGRWKRPGRSVDGLHEPKSAHAHARYPNQTMRPWREAV